MTQQPLAIDERATAGMLVGVRNPDRLKVVAETDLTGHVDDADLDAIVATLQIALDVSIAAVNIVTADLQTYPAEVGIGAPCSAVPDQISFCASVVETGLPLEVADARVHPVYGENPLVLQGLIGAYAGVPLLHNGAVLGTVSVFAGEARNFSTQDFALLGHQARLVSTVLALRRSARTDLVTGLPNRALFLDRLNRAILRLGRQPGDVCVMYVDIDGFKQINDERGHAAGDQVLRELGSRLSPVLRPSDTLARLGGDEFAVLCEGLPDAAAAAALAERLIGALDEPVETDQGPVPVQVSIGFAMSSPALHDPLALIHAADQAMYRAKRMTGSSAVGAQPGYLVPTARGLR